MYKKLCFLVLILMEIRQGKAISINWFLNGNKCKGLIDLSDERRIMYDEQRH